MTEDQGIYSIGDMQDSMEDDEALSPAESTFEQKGRIAATAR